MSNYQKRTSKPIQRPRKKAQPPMQSVKSSPQQGLSNAGDVGLYSNPHLTYYLARCVIGNVGEIYTNSSKCVGVIKAVSPNGNFGLKYVRTISNECEDGPFELEEEKMISLVDIKKIVLRNVKPSECQKDENISNEVNDDSDICLQHYFTPSEDTEAFNFNSEENFTPEEMFEVNAKLYNVTSSYQSSLEGYTLPLDKSDPLYKAKEMHYAKVAAEIEDGTGSSGWDNMLDEEIENNEEIQFSAVLKEGIAGRDVKNFTRNRRGLRVNNRASLPRDFSDVHRSGDGSTRQIKNTGSHDKISEIKQSTKINDDSTAEKVPHNDVKTSLSEDKPPSAVDASSTVPKSDASYTPKVSSESASTYTNKEEPKKFTLDPDAPEFKPSGLFSPIDQAPLQQQPVAPVPYAFVPTGFPQSIQCQTIPFQTFQVPAQTHMLNGNVNTQTVPFCMPSPVSYVVPSNMAQAFRQQQTLGYNPQQQVTVISQQLPVTGQQPVVSTSVSKNGVRSNLPPAGFLRQRPTDQMNPNAQQMQYQMFHTQPGNPFFPGGPHPPIQFITNASGGLHSSSYAGLTTMANTATVSQSSGQPMMNASHITPPQSIQLQLPQSNSQPMTSIPQGQNQVSQFHPCFQHPLGNVQQQAAFAAQYPGGQLISSQASGMPGTLSFYQSLYQPSGFIPIPLPQGQVGANGQSIQHQSNPQLHHPNQHSIGLSQAPIQLQQQQGIGVSVHPTQQQVLLQNQQYQVQPNLLNAQFLPQNVQLQAMLAMAMTGNPQAMQNSQNIHTQHHPMPVFMNQQPNGTG